MSCTIRISSNEKNPLSRTYTTDKPILRTGDRYKVVISKWTLHPNKRNLIRQMNPQMADFVYLLGDIVGLEDDLDMQTHSFSLGVLVLEHWDMIEDLVLQAFKQAYGFEELFVETASNAVAQK